MEIKRLALAAALLGPVRAGALERAAPSATPELSAPTRVPSLLVSSPAPLALLPAVSMEAAEPSAIPAAELPAETAPAPSEEPGLTPAHLEKLVSALRLIDQRFADKLSPEQWTGLIDKGLTAITDGLGDPYTAYFDQNAWAELGRKQSGRMAGIGFVLNLKREGRRAKDDLARAVVHKDGLRIEKVHAGSPAEAAGLRAGDSVVRVNGRKTGGRPLDKVLEEIRGPSGSEVRLTIVRRGRRLELAATRAETEVPLMNVAMMGRDIGYIYYREFRHNSEGRFLQALAQLRAARARKVIIDLRGNPGGSMETANNIVANLLPGGLETSSTRHRGEIVRLYKTQVDGPFSDMKIVVLIDEKSASGSELTAATMQDYGATVIGPKRNSFGKFGFQDAFVLAPDENSGIHITAGRFHSGKGRSFPGRRDPKTGRHIPGTGGVTPNVIVPMTERQQNAVRAATLARLAGADPKPVADPVLDKAIQILRKRR